MDTTEVSQQQTTPPDEGMDFSLLDTLREKGKLVETEADLDRLKQLIKDKAQTKELPKPLMVMVQRQTELIKVGKRTIQASPVIGDKVILSTALKDQLKKEFISEMVDKEGKRVGNFQIINNFGHLRTVVATNYPQVWFIQEAGTEALVVATDAQIKKEVFLTNHMVGLDKKA